VGGVFDIRPICPNKGEYLTVTVWMPRQGNIEENWRYLLASPVGLPANWRMCRQLPHTGATLSRLSILRPGSGSVGELLGLNPMDASMAKGDCTRAIFDSRLHLV
jgi:hypothetical protein